MRIEQNASQPGQPLLRFFGATSRQEVRRTCSKMGLVTSTPFRTTYWPLSAPYPAGTMRPVLASRPTVTEAEGCFFVLM